MPIDIWIAIVTVAMAALGGIVSAHGPQKRRHKWAYGLTFCLLAVISICLIKVQADENSKVQQKLQAQLDKIQHNTEQPPKVILNMPHPPEEGRTWIDTVSNWVDGQGPPFKPGSRLGVNVAFRNNPGNVPAKGFRMFVKAIEKDHRLTGKEEDIEYNKFLQGVRAEEKSAPSRTLAPGAITWLTIPRLKPFSEIEAADVAALKLWTYFFALAQHTDQRGKHETEVCTFYSGTGSTAVNCISHNGEKF